VLDAAELGVVEARAAFVAAEALDRAPLDAHDASPRASRQ
jgi:hypothetical protein